MKWLPKVACKWPLILFLIWMGSITSNALMVGAVDRDNNTAHFVYVDFAPPSVNTSGASSVTSSSATLNGNLTSLGNSGTANVSFEYGTSERYGNATAPQVVSNVGFFSTNITGLFPAMTYHFRAKAEGSSGIVFGSDMTFKTLPGGYVPSTIVEVKPPTVKLTINTTGLGFVNSTGIGAHESGTTVSISAYPQPGWQFAGWTGDVVANASSANTTIIMNGDKSVTAHFELIPPAPDNSTSPNISGNATSSTAQSNGLLWLFVALGATIALIALILLLRRKRY